MIEYHKPSGFDQQKFILSNSFGGWTSDIKGSLRAILSMKALGENLFCFFFLAAGVANNPWYFLAYHA